MSALLYILLIFSAIELGIMLMLVFKIEDCFDTYNTIMQTQSKLYKDSLNDLLKMYDNLSKIDDKRNEMMNAMSDAYKLMREGYDVMIKYQKDMMESCRNCEEHYSDIFEQYEQIGKALSDIYAKQLERECLCQAPKGEKDS